MYCIVGQKRSHEETIEETNILDTFKKRKINHNLMMCDNKIFFNEKINENSILNLKFIIDQINNNFNYIANNKLIKEAIPNPILLFITSKGGDLLSTFKAIDLIERSSIPIYTIIDGPINDSAFILALHGKKRFITKNSFIFFNIENDLRSKDNLQQEDINSIENNDYFLHKINDIFINKTHLDSFELKKLLSERLIFDSIQAISNGFVDDIYDNETIV